MRAVCVQLDPLPASAAVVGLYLTSMAKRGLAVSTIRRRAAAIARAHRQNGHLSATSDPRVLTVLEGIARVHGSEPLMKRRQPVCVCAEVGKRAIATIAPLLAFLLVFAMMASLAAARGSTQKAPVARASEVYTCGTFKNSWFDGYSGYLQQGTAEGSYATIQTRYGAVCDTDTNSEHNFTTAWAMIASDNNLGGYVQSGFLRGYNQCMVYFAETRRTSSYPFDSKFGTSCIATDGSTHGYAEPYGSGCGCEYAKIDGTVWMTTSWNPFQYWAYPFVPQFFGEATYLESDMPGNSASPTNFAHLQQQNSSDNQFSNLGCNLAKSNDGSATRTDGEAWYNQTTSCPAFRIYTDTAGL